MTGEEVYPTLYSIRESPVQRGVIWTGANDGPFHVTRDNGVTWTNITPSDLPPGGRVAMIDPSPHRAGSAYYAVYRYLLGDFAPYVYETNDFGRTWKRLTTGSNGIPADDPVRVVREDPSRAGLLYAGTEFGMYVSLDDGANWQPLQLNLPVVPINDIKVFRKDLLVATQGRSFWILDDLTPLHQATASLASAPATLLKPRDAYRMRYSVDAGFGRASGPWMPQYPQPGAMIDYYLASAPAGSVLLDISDSTGKLVRTFSSTRGEVRDTTPPTDEESFGRRGSAAIRIPATVGLNRFIWDLTYPGPDDRNGAPQDDGPMVVPGTYKVRLRVVGGRGDTLSTTTDQMQTLVVREDPRVLADGVTLADLREQLLFNLRVRDLVSDANRAAGRLRSTRSRLRTPPGRALTPFTAYVRWKRPCSRRRSATARRACWRTSRISIQ